MFSQSFREFLLEQGTTINALARATGIPQGTISGWVNRGSKPNIEDIIKIADYFQCSIDYVVSRELEDGRLPIEPQIHKKSELEKINDQLDTVHKAILLGYATALLQEQRRLA